MSEIRIVKEESLLQDGEVLELTDFFYAECNGTIYCDKVNVYKDVGVFFYKNNELIMKKTGKVHEVRLIEVGEAYSHYYIKIDDVHAIYLKKKLEKSEEKKEFQIGDTVFSRSTEKEHDIIPFGVTMGYVKFKEEQFEAEKIKQIEDSLIQDLGYVVIEIIDHEIVCIEREGERKYVAIKDVFTIEEMKKNAEHLIEMQEEKKKK